MRAPVAAAHGTSREGPVPTEVPPNRHVTINTERADSIPKNRVPKGPRVIVATAITVSKVEPGPTPTPRAESMLTTHAPSRPRLMIPAPSRGRPKRTSTKVSTMQKANTPVAKSNVSRCVPSVAHMAASTATSSTNRISAT
jgi:hypothetical protein